MLTKTLCPEVWNRCKWVVPGGDVELGERRQLVLRVVEAEPADRIARGRVLGGIADHLEEGLGRIHVRVPQIERAQRLTGRQEMVVGIDQPGQERPTVEVVLDGAGMVVTNLRRGTDTEDRRAVAPRMPATQGRRRFPVNTAPFE